MDERERLLAHLRQIIDLLPQMVYVKDRAGNYRLANAATARALGTTADALCGQEAEADEDAVDATLEQERLLMEEGMASVVPEEFFVDARGHRRILRTTKIPYQLPGDEERVLLCVSADITDEKHARDVLKAQNRILRDLSRGAELQTVLDALVGAAEEIVPGMSCSILLLDSATRRLEHGSAPSLPRYYNEAIEGLEIGPTEGSCGAAAFLGERVVVEDVLVHPNWAPYRDLARKVGFRACWSQPILSANGEVRGTFAMYYQEPRSPEPFELEFIEAMANVAGIAIDFTDLKKAGANP